jgi:transcription initiation factor TFIID TATA-box-binding protein
MDCIESDSLFLIDNLKVSSIVFSMYLDQKVDIERAREIFDDCKSFDGVRLNFRLLSPKATVCMSKSGYIRSMGTKTIDDAKKAVQYAIDRLSEEGLVSNPVISKERIENIVASGAFPQTLDLEYYADVLSNNIYEPEQFPAVIYRPAGKVVCLLFASGKYVIVGAKTLETVRSTYVTLRSTLNIDDA